MTKEDAEKYIKSEMCKNCSVYLGGGKCSDNCKVIEAIKALEQEPILGKLRAEIKQKIKKRPGLNHSRMERDRNDAFLEVLDIIDGYRKFEVAEQEAES